MVHRKLRPEAAGGRVDRTKGLLATYPLHPDILNSVAVSAMQTSTGSWLLSQAFPEGSPAHPSYGAGHATVAGACVTILKFWFQEDHILPNPVVPSANGTVLLSYTGPDLTVGGELNKVASNVAIGRNIAGVHWVRWGQPSLTSCIFFMHLFFSKALGCHGLSQAGRAGCRLLFAQPEKDIQ